MTRTPPGTSPDEPHTYVLIRAHPRAMGHVADAARKLPEVSRVECVIDGLYDVVLELVAGAADDPGEILGLIRSVPGVESAEICRPALHPSDPLTVAAGFGGS